jgi:hypothetical protein
MWSLGAHAALVAAALAGGSSHAGAPRSGGFFAPGMTETTVVIELVAPSDLAVEPSPEPAPRDAVTAAPRTVPRHARAAHRSRPAPVAMVTEAPAEVRPVEPTLHGDPDEEAPDAEEAPRGPALASLRGAGGAGTSVTAQLPQPIQQNPVVSLKWGYRRIEQSFPRLPQSLWVHGKIYSVELQLCVAADGQVSQVGLRRGAARELDEVVVATARTWRYRPYTVDGVARPFCHLMKIDYEVD